MRALSAGLIQPDPHFWSRFRTSKALWRTVEGAPYPLVHMIEIATKDGGASYIQDGYVEINRPY